MIVDFAKIDVKNQPLLILQNLDDTPIGVLKSAAHVEADLCYNELSSLSFDLPAFSNGCVTANYSQVVGMRVVELQKYGRFLLFDPVTDNDGLKEIKHCTAYSLEYEFTFKKMVLAAGTYNFYDPYAPGGTILGMILDAMPSWKIGKVDASLIGRYRTFDDSGDQNIYNFMKSNLQESYGCIFNFDTFTRKIYVQDITTEANVKPVYFSMDNLVKSVKITEDSENIVTKLNVTGADGVDIRSVNPMGTTSIINLDYFMTRENFSQQMIDKYNAWKETFESYQRQYFNLTVEEALKTAQYLTERAALVTLNGEYTSLENLQAVTIQAIAQGLKSQSDLNGINAQLRSKKNEITAKEREIDVIIRQVEALNVHMREINGRTSLESFFTAEEYKIIDRYLKEDSISEDSFVVPEVDTYDAAGESMKLSGSIFDISGSAITKSVSASGKDIYSIGGGVIGCSTAGFSLSANVIMASMDYESNGNALFTARLSRGTFNGKSFPSACVSLSGTVSAVNSNVTPNASVHGAISEGTNLSFKVGSANLYFTRSTTEYEQRSVEWDLFDYGKEFLKKVAWPSYTFSLDLANFLAVAEFEPFKKQLELGEKLYWKQPNGNILKPILIKVHIPFDDPEKFAVELSSKCAGSGGDFTYQDLINDSKTAGNTINSGKWTYNQFVNSGAETALGNFMRSALDIAKNNIISSSGQAISWDGAGFRLRKRVEGSSDFDPYQIWMNNATIMFTTDNWQTANLAIGQIKAEDGSVHSGVIADQLIGKIVAANNLTIESAKKDGMGNSVFRVDANGASLHNAIFDLYNGNNTQITLNPYTGIAIGKYPLYSGNQYTIDEDNAVFWVDMDGNLHLKGTLEGVDGKFSGTLEGATGRFKGIVQASDFQDLSGNSMIKNYKFMPDYLELRGLTITDGTKTTFQVTAGGVVTINAKVTMTPGSSIDWGNVKETNVKNNEAYKLATNASTVANNAFDRADTAYNEASDAWGFASDAYYLAWNNRNTDVNIFNVLTNKSTRFGIFSDSATNKLYINANYIRTGTIDAEVITLGSARYGGFSCGRGHNGERYTYGPVMFGDQSTMDAAENKPYFIVTDCGCRMSTSATEFYITKKVIHASQAITVSSDRRIKNHIEYDLSQYEKFMLSLQPTRFRYNSGTSERFHLGFIAQDVEQALLDNGLTTKDFAGLVIQDIADPGLDGIAGSKYNLRYEEFISLNTYMIQKLHREIQELKREISTLKGNNNG